MARRFIAAMALALGAVSLGTSPVAAQEKIKIGMIVDFSGPFATVGAMLRQGAETYVSEHGAKIGGREVEWVYRDVAGNPANAKTIAEEMIVKDKVSLITGFALTPQVAAVAAVVNQAKIPTVIMVPSTPSLMSPYFVRASNNMQATVTPAAEWAAKNGKRKAYIAVSDYAPGYEVQATFKRRFTELGGTIVGEDRIPLNTVDYAPFAERIVQSGADVVDVFIPPGAPAISFTRGLVAQGIAQKGIAVIGIGETNEVFLPIYDESVLGFRSSYIYSSTLPNKENEAFKKALAAKFDKAIPDPFVMVGYDGAHLLYKMIESQQGKPFDGAAAVNALKGYKWDSPRGPVMIDAETRDIVENMYIRNVERVNGKLENVIVDTFPMVKPTFVE
jgi:branched-chain amino acid transport system substrate-binding protein